MSDEQLQTIAYLYGRSREQLKHNARDVTVYEGVIAWSQWLWNTLQENSAVYNGRLKRKYQSSMEAGSKSLEVKQYKVHHRRVFEVENRSQLGGTP